MPSRYTRGDTVRAELAVKKAPWLFGVNVGGERGKRLLKRGSVGRFQVGDDGLGRAAVRCLESWSNSGTHITDLCVNRGMQYDGMRRERATL